MDPRAERGGVILGGLGRTVVVLLLIALMVFEFGAWATNVFQLDSVGQRAARAAADALRDAGTRSAVGDAALAALDGQRGVTLQSVRVVGDGSVEVVLRRAAPVLVLDHIGPLRERLVATATKTARAVP